MRYIIVTTPRSSLYSSEFLDGKGCGHGIALLCPHQNVVRSELWLIIIIGWNNQKCGKRYITHKITYIYFEIRGFLNNISKKGNVFFG